MGSPRSGSARDVVYRALATLEPNASAGEVVRAVGGQVERYAVDVALATGVREGDIKRTGEPRSYRYTLRAGVTVSAPAAPTVVPPPGAKGAAQAPTGDALAPALGTRCAMPAPENRSQGTIAQALRAVMSADAPMSIDEIFLALPIGWSRAEALGGLKEAALDGWVNFGSDGWELVGDPPEARAADPLVIADIPSHARLRLEEIRGSLNELLRDAIQLQDHPVLIRSLANAYAETDSALTYLRS